MKDIQKFYDEEKDELYDEVKESGKYDPDSYDDRLLSYTAKLSEIVTCLPDDFIGDGSGELDMRDTVENDVTMKLFWGIEPEVSYVA